ncbi:MAG: molybdenum cofactor guanylyltransferase [Coriobacteriales bacterium]|nr:molybdenum cofactor guanylyltransferase [Coriobacteriales bacterium]
MNKNNNLSIVIQGGGQSKRMGTSKTCVDFLGKPLIWRSIDRLLDIASEFIITTNETEKLGFLSELVESGKVKLVKDINETRGALPGICTAFTAASCDYVALIACDMVFPSPNLIRAELEALKNNDVDMAIPITTNGYEPFHGVYKRDTCLKAANDAFKAGQSRANSWFENVKVFEFDAEMVNKAEPRGGCFINVNTPAELKDAEEKAKSGYFNQH